MSNRMATGDSSNYIEALRSSWVQNALSNREIPTEFLATCIEAGIVNIADEALLFEIEKSAGRRIKPMNPPTTDLSKQASSPSARQNGPVMGSAKPPCLRNLPTNEMYRQAVAEMDAAMASSKILDDKHYPKCIVHNARRVWCTPGLMRTLVADPSYVDKLRAAMYPATVSYCERTFEGNGRTYTVPYITIMEYCERDGIINSLKKGEDEKDYTYNGRFAISTTFYLDKNGGIGAMTGSKIHLYDPADFSSPQAVKNYMREIERAYEQDWNGAASDYKKREKNNLKKLKAFLEPYASGKTPISDPVELMKQFMKLHKSLLGCDTENEFINIKTGEVSYATIRHNIKEVRKYGNDWFKVIDVTGAMRDGKVQRGLIAGEYDKQRPGGAAEDKGVADLSLHRLYERMMKTQGLEERLIGYVDPDGEEEYLKYDYSI